MSEEQDKQFLKQNWQTIAIVLCIVAIGTIWNFYQSAKTKYDTLSKQISITETIKQTEARLEEVKAREIIYKDLEQKTNTLMKSLNILEAKQRELEKRKKEVIANEIKNYTQNDIKNALAGINIQSYVVE